MAKGQKKSNKEIKKPKQVKTTAAATATFEKGLSEANSSSKKKGEAK
jgi:hypothetical protein